tara:strand:- start:43193 stop:43399 length:207 start_codon:yes stop_codon:yes gene_type:complete
MSKTPAKAVERKDYKLSAAHTHGGKDCAAGDTVSLTARQAAFIKHKLVGQDSKTANPAEAEAPAVQEG